MTQKLVFSEIMGKAWQIIETKKSVPDVILMDLLGFTPPSWKVWKPKLIEIFMIQKLHNPNPTNKESDIMYKIEYNKSKKLWEIKEIDKNQNQ